ncbi:MAG: PEP-CTERM sorting domain-containing protein [Pirellulales bacterium]|nr:PEP-CTERM sorting domain-containing protein [Pirellulales bacterium]
MRRMSILVVGCIALAVLVVWSPVSADDLIPAPWRGQPNTTIQETDFPASWNLAWDSYTNPFGEPSIWMYSDIWQLDDNLFGRSGVISWENFENGFSIDIPNSPDPNIEKRIWVQVTYYGQGPTIWEAMGLDAGAGSWGPGLPDLIDSIDHGDGWITEAREMVIRPNPTGEFVGIRWTGAGVVDQILVETICVPEPATLTLVLGALAVLLVVRRRR